MQVLFKAIGRVSTPDPTALIRGESVTDKELVLRVIYPHSLRSDKLFLVINCVAIPTICMKVNCSAIEGAFTGASHHRIDKIEQNNAGAVFLDAFGDVPVVIQAKILRSLHEKSVERIGGWETIPVDIRLIAATKVFDSLSMCCSRRPVDVARGPHQSPIHQHVARKNGKKRELSEQALMMEDKKSYKAVNRQALDAFGHFFSYGAALFCVSIWPMPFLLAWMHMRFANAPVELPIYLPILGDSIDYFTISLLLYIFMRTVYSNLTGHLAWYGRLREVLIGNKAGE